MGELYRTILLQTFMEPSSERHTIFLIFNVISGEHSMTLFKTLIYSYTQAGRVFWKDLESDDSYGQKSSLEILKDLVKDSHSTALYDIGIHHLRVDNLTWKNSFSEPSFQIGGESDANAMITYCENSKDRQQPIEIGCRVIFAPEGNHK